MSWLGWRKPGRSESPGGAKKRGPMAPARCQPVGVSDDALPLLPYMSSPDVGCGGIGRRGGSGGFSPWRMMYITLAVAWGMEQTLLGRRTGCAEGNTAARPLI